MEGVVGKVILCRCETLPYAELSAVKAKVVCVCAGLCVVGCVDAWSWSPKWVAHGGAVVLGRAVCCVNKGDGS